jgi:hypothetical protein
MVSYPVSFKYIALSPSTERTVVDYLNLASQFCHVGLGKERKTGLGRQRSMASSRCETCTYQDTECLTRWIHSGGTLVSMEVLLGRSAQAPIGSLISGTVTVSGQTGETPEVKLARRRRLEA